MINRELCGNLPVAILYTDSQLNIDNNMPLSNQYGSEYELKQLLSILYATEVQKKERVQQWIGQIISKGKVVCEISIQDKKGMPKWACLRGQLQNAKDPSDGFIWCLADITELRADQEEMLLMASVFNNSSEGMLFFSQEAGIVKLNAALQNLTGYVTADVQGQSMFSLFDDQHETNLADKIWNQLRRQHEWRGELQLKKKCGELLPVQVLFNCMYAQESLMCMAFILDITEHKEEKEELKYRANHDPLTDLVNRNGFFDALNKAMALAERQHFSVALLYLDLDSFKMVNDALGHGMGDKVLQDVATTLLACVRDTDTVARMGGDEFAIILNGSSEAFINETAQRLVDKVDFHVRQNIWVTVSIGVAVFPCDGLHPSKLLECADKAMYYAKQNGKKSYYWHKRANNHV